MPPTPKKREAYIATQSGVCEIDGEPHVFVKGKTLVESGHKLLAACPDYFEPVEHEIHYENATAER